MRNAIALPPTFTFSQAMRLGLSRRGLQALLDSGAIERRGRGLFSRTDSVGDDPELAAAALVAPRATLCLASALARHELIDAIPGSIDLALPRGTRLPATRLPVTWHRFAASTFEIGRGTVDVDGRKLGLYDPPRSIVDSFRLRHREGHEQGLEALKAWLRRRGSQPASLLAVARAIDPRAATVIARALEILL